MLSHPPYEHFPDDKKTCDPATARPAYVLHPEGLLGRPVPGHGCSCQLADSIYDDSSVHLCVSNTKSRRHTVRLPGQARSQVNSSN